MTARFILSLDCEGKWGMADRLTPRLHAALSDERLRTAYDDLVAMLDELDVPATFAFVGTFSAGPDRLRVLRAALEELAGPFPDYLGPALADLARPRAEGWSGEWALDAVAGAWTRHEIGLHGATHVPWDHPAMTVELARRELGVVFDAGLPIARAATTYVYPRNAVAHREVLDEFGIAGARGARRRRSRPASLLTEFDLTVGPDPDPPAAVPVEIPAGYFVNWLAGARRVVPPAVSVRRVRAMLERAADSGGLVHLWTHPENIATAPSTLGLLRRMLAEVVRLRDAGRCEVLTQEQYCRGQAPAHVARAADTRNARLGGAR